MSSTSTHPKEAETAACAPHSSHIFVRQGTGNGDHFTILGFGPMPQTASTDRSGGDRTVVVTERVVRRRTVPARVDLHHSDRAARVAEALAAADRPTTGRLTP